MRPTPRTRVLALAAGLAFILAASPAGAGKLDGKTSCAEINPLLAELTYPSGALSVGQVISDGTLSVTVTGVASKAFGTIGFTGTSDIVVRNVIVAAGSATKVYGHFAAFGTGSLLENPSQPAAKGRYLYSPVDATSRKHLPITSLSFCYAIGET
jgi:hypothetical protein